MTAILTRDYSTGLQIREEGDGRTLTGLAVPWNVEARIAGRYVETFTRGAFADDLADPGRVPLTATHPRDGGTLPIGLTVELRDEEDGLHGDWKVSSTGLGDEVLALARDGVRLGLSVGFVPVTDRGTEARGKVERLRATLDHVAIVRVPAYSTARIAALRHAQGADALLLRLARLR